MGRNKTITFFEHQKKTFKELEKEELSKNEVKKLIKLNDKLKIFEIGYSSVNAKQFVGALKIKNKTIQILPKIYNNEENKEKEALTNLLYMLSYTKKLKIREDIANLTKNNDLFEIYIYLFAKNLLKEIEKGFYKDYNKKEENLNFLKGKLNTTKQIKHNIINKHKLHCTYKEFSENNLINQILKYTIELLKNITKSSKNKKLLDNLSFIFEDVEYKIITLNDFKKIHFNRMSERFKYYVEMAELFILNSSINLNSKDFHTFSLIFDMNTLFEEFIGNIVKNHKDEIFGNENLNVHLQHTKHYLLRAAKIEDSQGTEDSFNFSVDKNNRGAFRLIPDIAVLKENKPYLIIDTKYKKLDQTKPYSNISQSDIYQMFAHLKKYDCKKGILLYPKYNEEIKETFYIDNKTILHIVQIDLKYNMFTGRTHYINKIKKELSRLMDEI